MNASPSAGLATPPFGPAREAPDGRPDQGSDDPTISFAAPQFTSPQYATPHAAAQPPSGASYPTGGFPGPQPAGPYYPAPPGIPPLDRTSPHPQQPPRRRAGALLAVASLAAVIGAGAGAGSFALLAERNATSTVGVSTVPAAQAPKLDGTIAAAAGTIEPSVVTITAQAGGGGGIGTGVVLDDQGHILTNNHVVEPASNGGTLSVTFNDGDTVAARLVGTSVSNDLAVIKVEKASGLKPATFAKSSSLRVGQAVVAVGAPLGLSESVTSGIVSNAARPVRSGTNNDAVYLAVQTDAAINPGNSGGPLVDLNGAVVGINSSIATTGSAEGGQSGNIGIGFAIPSDVAVRVAGELIATGHSANAALGVTVGGDSGSSVSTGVALQTVVAGGAADKAGLRAGDVVTKVDSYHTTTADGLIAATRFHAPGSVVAVRYVRDGGAPQTVEVTLGSQ